MRSAKLISTSCRRGRCSGSSRSVRVSSSSSRAVCITDIDARDGEPQTVHLWIEDDLGRVVSTLRLLDEGASRTPHRSRCDARRGSRSRLFGSAAEARDRAVRATDHVERAGVSRRLVRALRIRDLRRALDRGRHRARADAPRRQSMTMLTMRSTTAITLLGVRPSSKATDARMRERQRRQGRLGRSGVHLEARRGAYRSP